MRRRGFFAELKRRHVYRAGVIYAMTAWLLIQVATQVFPFFNVPNWVIRLIVVVFALGFPVALTIAWVYEITPGGVVKTDDLADPKPPRTRRFRFDIAIIAVLFCIIAALLVQEHRNILWGGESRGKSIAVLPFANFSDDKENAFFADGIQDSVLTDLAKIKDLKVISRTSVMKYRDTENRDIRQIGDSLGVANILEGSVRRAGNRVAVNVQLIDAETDHHLWAHRYERTLADSLGLEGDLATEIASALRATLTPDEKIRVKHKPTENADAYDLYLRALPYEQGPDTLLQDYRRAEQLYARAIALDPNFALAHARLASTYAEIYHFHEPLETWEKKAKSEAEIALELEPNLSEAHFALGQCAYWMDGDYDRALVEFNRAQELAPNDANIGMLIAAIRRRQGHWEEALADYQRIEKVDPENPNIVRNLLITNTAMRKWPEAARAAARLRAIAPDSVVAKIQTGYIDFWWHASTAQLHAQLAQIPPQNDPDGVATSCRWEAAMLDGAYAQADAILKQTDLDAVDYLNGGTTPKSFLAGCSALARGDTANATTQFQQARDVFERQVEEAPDSADRHANLGLLYAFLGRKDDALREGRRAVELKPENKDAFDGAIMQAYLALIYARVGENDLAFPLITRLLHTAGSVDSADYSITRSDLEKRWEWAGLRQDPRFAQLFPTR
ncbi:MAG TPA: tetratricopeptide repeat protein, partial [Chthoniobacterales bacterium]|nr:tetratricopeptide repeat protein [Chthoniobacterales bacterium]